MNEFRPGQQVRCIAAKHTDCLSIGVYTVREVFGRFVGVHGLASLFEDWRFEAVEGEL